MGIFNSQERKIGIAVVGLGYIAQAAALPGLEKTSNCKIAALVSGDSTKRKELADRYNVGHLYSYEAFEECLSNPEVEAVYIALPNSMHKDFVIRAAQA